MTVDQDISDLIDGPAQAPRTARRYFRPSQTPTKRERQSVVMARLDRFTEARRHREDDPNATASLDLSDVLGGVSAGWLAKVFGMDPSDVKKRLADCPVLDRKKVGYRYSLPVAVRYLVKPEFDASSYIRNMKPSELPPQLQAAYWDSALKRQKWEENAGHLWRTEAVMEVLGDSFKTLKNSLQLFADNLERVSELTDKQREILVKAVDGLQDELYKNLVQMSKDKRTSSSKNEMNDAAEPGFIDELI